jgi:hypothetical protein
LHHCEQKLMSFTANTDFLALLRLTSGGIRTERMPGLDYVVQALARMGIINLSVSAVAPAANQATTVWLQPFVPSWVAEGTVFLWNVAAGQYQVATPALWSAFFLASGSAGFVVQNITAAGPTLVQVNASIVLVQNVGASVALTMPLAATMGGPVLISDWANHAGANNITIGLTGTDTFPLAAATQTIAADGASVFLRPVPGGYAL